MSQIQQGDGIATDESVNGIQISTDGNTSEMDVSSEYANEVMLQIVDEEMKLIYTEVLHAVCDEQTGLSCIAARIIKDKFIYDLTSNQFFKFDGKIWTKDEEGQVVHTVLVRLDSILTTCSRLYGKMHRGEAKGKMTRSNPFEKALKNIHSIAYLEKIVDFTRKCDKELCIQAGKWEDDLETLNTPTGIVNLRTGTLKPITPRDYRRLITKVGYYPENSELSGEPVLWIHTLRDIFKLIGRPNPLGINASQDALKLYNEQNAAWADGTCCTQMIDFMQVLLGYCLLGTNPLQKFIIFIGDHGRNGKGVICHTLGRILGDYVVEVRSEMFMKNASRTSYAATPDIMSLIGKRIYICSENDRGDTIHAPFIKRVTGGDMLSGRRLYCEEESFRPKGIPLLLTNFSPYSDSEDQAFWARRITIPFQRTFVEQPDRQLQQLIDKDPYIIGTPDPELEKKLEGEHEKILAWMIEGAKKYFTSGLVIPDFIIESNQKYRNDADTIQDFIDVCCEREKDNKGISSSDLYGTYAQYCETNGYSKLNQRNFKERMQSRGFTYNKSNNIVCRDIKLSTIGENYLSAFNNKKGFTSVHDLV